MQANGFSMSEIAQVVGVQEQSVATYISRARIGLRQAYNYSKTERD
jgi:DNA-directed RNA polymerase specialized sigma24 family protein